MAGMGIGLLGGLGGCHVTYRLHPSVGLRSGLAYVSQIKESPLIVGVRDSANLVVVLNSIQIPLLVSFYHDTTNTDLADHNLYSYAGIAWRCFTDTDLHIELDRDFSLQPLKEAGTFGYSDWVFLFGGTFMTMPIGIQMEWRISIGLAGVEHLWQRDFNFYLCLVYDFLRV